MDAMSSHLITLGIGLVAGAAITYLLIALRAPRVRPGGRASANLKLITGHDNEVSQGLLAVPLDRRPTLFPQETLVDIAQLRPGGVMQVDEHPRCTCTTN